MAQTDPPAAVVRCMADTTEAQEFGNALVVAAAVLAVFWVLRVLWI